jgi:hypothetical protein
MIEDTPELVASQQEAKQKLELAKAERARKKQEKASSSTQSQQSTSQPSQTRYELRKKLNSTKTYTVWKILKPP